MSLTEFLVSGNASYKINVHIILHLFPSSPSTITDLRVVHQAGGDKQIHTVTHKYEQIQTDTNNDKQVQTNANEYKLIQTNTNKYKQTHANTNEYKQTQTYTMHTNAICRFVM